MGEQVISEELEGEMRSSEMLMSSDSGRRTELFLHT